jgi:RimJ/RimL family protein N-acetyltransferase
MNLLSSARLLVRNFEGGDFSDFLALSVDWKSAPGPEWDKWPVDENGCGEFLDYLCAQKNFYAVYLCDEKKLIGLLAINKIDENKRLDLGHVLHSAYQDNDIDREALEMMVDYIFKTMDVDSIITGNYPNEEQIAPLKSLGFSRGENDGVYTMERGRWKNDAWDTNFAEGQKNIDTTKPMK